MVCRLGSCGWNGRWRNTVLVGGFGCSAVVMCWLVMKVVAFLWAWWKSGVIVSGGVSTLD